MALEHSFLPGTGLNYQNSLFFDLMESGDVYMGFARSEPIWGFSSLLKILHTNDWADGIMGQSGETGGQDTRFYDKNSTAILSSGDLPSSGGDDVYIAYIDKLDSVTVISNFNFLSSVDIGTLTLDYMNKEWARLSGINTDFLEQTITSNPVGTYDYYLFNFSQNIDSRTQIETVSAISLPTISNPIRLMYSTGIGAVPTTAFGNNLVGDLVRTVNVLGESTITGLTSTFVTNGDGYIADNSLASATYYLTSADGVIIQDNMKFVQKISTDDEVSIIFSYPLVTEAVQNSGRLKITTTANADKLAIFSERFSDGTFVTDNNPPALTTNYLKTGMVHTSLFDILGLVRISAGDVDFVRRVDNKDTETLLINAGLDVGIAPTVGADAFEITLNGDASTTVRYAFTNDISIARLYYFDLVRIQKTLDTTTPTDQIYRQLFLCYLPKDSVGDDLDLSTTEFTHSDLFQSTVLAGETRQSWGYDLGTIMYLANKQPVFRAHLAQDEDITILI